jgi:hypothetical protein
MKQSAPGTEGVVGSISVRKGDYYGDGKSVLLPTVQYTNG